MPLIQPKSRKNPAWRGATAWLLAAHYTVVATLGWGLHALAPCSNHGLHDGCGGVCELLAGDHSHQSSPADGSNCSLSAADPDATTHGASHECLICSLLANMELARATHSPTFSTAAEFDHSPAIESHLNLTQTIRAFSARGPPIS